MVRTRIAPSPTGHIHIGTLQTALFNYAYARKNNGKWVIRIEDTDRGRFVEGAVEEVLEVLKAYGLEYDEGPDRPGNFGPYTQSERLEIYKEKAMELVESGHAYYCFCSKEDLDAMRQQQMKEGKQPRYEGHCRELEIEKAKEYVNEGREYVIRLRIPRNKTISQKNMFGKEFSFNSNDIDDQILLKSDGYPTYYLAVVVDDHLMDISHVLKAVEWQSSDPKLLVLYDAFGWDAPQFGYLPLLLDPKGGKLSKREGSVSAKDFLVEGFLPEAVINYLMFMGWNPGDDREIFSLDQFVEEFDVKKLNPTSAVFDRKKLEWINGVYLRDLEVDEYTERFLNWIEGYGINMAKNYDYVPAITTSDTVYLKSVLALEKERAKTFSELLQSIDFFFTEGVSVEEDKKYLKLKQEDFGEIMGKLILLLSEFDDDSEKWSHEEWEAIIRGAAKEVGWKDGDLFMLLRFAITGRSISPELFLTMQTLGKERSILRMESFKEDHG